jgi:hypothetical protein
MRSTDIHAHVVPRTIAARIFQSAAEIDPDGTELLED